MNLKAVVELFQETFQEWSKDKASRLAAALSYYTIFSIAPLLIIVIAIVGAVFGEAAAQDAIRQQLEGLVGRDGAGVIQEAIKNANQPRAGIIASIISVIVLLFGATGLFTELQDALNTIWEVQPKPGRVMKNIVRQRVTSFAMVLVIGFLLLVSLVISGVLVGLVGYFRNVLPGVDFIWQFVNFLLGFVITTLLFGLIFKVLPDVKITWNDVLIGAALTSFLFSIGRYVLGQYLGNGSFGSAYGAAGSVVVILAWVNYAAQILFFGAEFTQVYARKYGSRIVPDKHAVPLTEDARLNQGMKPNNRNERTQKRKRFGDDSN
ncbi:YihY/virulence factor BrkB family protein [Brasilonema octagenarum UFV-E1]|uniref:YihY/virulence factor BrkB family protein n=2 Tax=Brasilonema TaxID=383614 RepID=A0A856MKK4_9CYAN|nr:MULTISPECIES: YihY/virulence factor BrkB family protein [Brasilonema]NMF65158.1 YihY/virulence factor BrkB family protein [Brasilonema octagenarum UFV-OR1]QDL11082.1 YihY/virulence factor BrkB family protein [Brasilonema sennae CENA114]QDL17426.1 YihY/virulence factor BrkB family protein [Brasilonema octagenarum UFV-E1]